MFEQNNHINKWKLSTSTWTRKPWQLVTHRIFPSLSFRHSSESSTHMSQPGSYTEYSITRTSRDGKCGPIISFCFVPDTTTPHNIQLNGIVSSGWGYFSYLIDVLISNGQQLQGFQLLLFNKNLKICWNIIVSKVC